MSSALAEVVQHQRREHQPEPRDADRPFSEVPHVGVERLGAGEASSTAPITTNEAKPWLVRN